MRGRMNDTRSYVPPFAIGEPLQGHAVGVVTESRDPELPEGSLVSSMFGWREGYVAPGSSLQRLPAPPSGVEPSAYLGVLGMPGFTAWVGITVIAPVAEGADVFVSAAAGAVGSVAGQLARARGAANVVGSAGSPAKVAALREVFGYTAAFSHLDGRPGEHLSELAPKGIDVYFDNVGGEQLRAAIDAMKAFGRIALCGSIASGYTGAAGAAVDNLGLVVGKRLTLRGFLVSDHGDRQPEFLAEVGGMLADGRIVSRETVHEGIESAPGAFLGLFSGGDQIGKVVVSCGGRGRPAGR
jgi:NADPH-dependent curcumin reductase CurA